MDCKHCIKCGEEKPLECFGKHSQTKDGLRTYCKKCVNEQSKSRYEITKDVRKISIAKWKAANPEKVKEINKRSYQNNIDKVIAYRAEKQDYHKQKSAQHYKDNKESYRAKNKVYSKNNRPKMNAKQALYRAAKKQATPIWYESEKHLVKMVYQKAKEMGSQVDHVVPLSSDKVCGLHCWSNLQILPLEENSKKCNYYWPDMP